MAIVVAPSPRSYRERVGVRGSLDRLGLAEGPLTRIAPDDASHRPFDPTSPRIRLRPKAGFGGQERGEVNRTARTYRSDEKPSCARKPHARAKSTRQLRPKIGSDLCGGQIGAANGSAAGPAHRPPRETRSI